MKRKEKQPLDGSFDPSRQLDKLDKVFAESIEELIAQGGDDNEWESVDEESALQTSSDISEQFSALMESKRSKRKRDKKKAQPAIQIPDDDGALVLIPTLDGEEEAAEQRELTSNEEYDKLFEELNKKETPEKKDKDMYRAHFRFINAACCMLCIFGVFAYLLFAQRESGFINSENRMLAKMPSLSRETYLDGSFARGITDYFTDTIPDREELKRISANITSHFGINDEIRVSGNLMTAKKEFLEEPEKLVTKATANVNIAAAVTKADAADETPDETKKETKATAKETKKKTPVYDDGKVFGSVIISGKGKDVRAVSAFYGTFENSKKYAEVINKYKKALGLNVNVYSMPIPISSAYYLPKNFENTVASQSDNMEVMERTFNGVISVNVYDALAEHTDEYIYSRTDHHWQPLGAYYAGKVFAETAGVYYPGLSEYGKYFKENFCGTMYMYSDYNEELKKNPDTFTYYKPKNDYQTYYYKTDFTSKTASDLFFDYAEGVNTYSVFMGKDETICRIDTDVKNSRTLVIFKDSFGNALVPFMVNAFEHIYVCDFRYFDVNAIDFVKKVNCTDLLFAISISSMDTPSHIKTLDRIRIQ